MPRRSMTLTGKIFLGAAATACVLWGLPGLGRAAEKPPLKGNEEVVETRGEVKKGVTPGEAVPKNGTQAAPVKPRASAVSCDVWVDNHTDWIIHRIYIDDHNWGSVGRTGDAIARDVIIGRTKLYAEADFTDGTTRTWGPRYFDCDRYQRFRWSLYP